MGVKVLMHFHSKTNLAREICYESGSQVDAALRSTMHASSLVVLIIFSFGKYHMISKKFQLAFCPPACWLNADILTGSNI